MDSLQRGIITLVRSGITGECLDLPADFDLEEAYDTVVKHQLMPIVYVGAVRCGFSKKLPVMKKLFAGYGKSLVYSEGQMREVDKVCQAFDVAEIQYMSLKGCRLKKLYPKPELRTMGDADILIRLEQYEKIRSIVAGLGFIERKESNHELVWEKDDLCLELHKCLIPSYNKDYYRYFGDGWQFAVHQNGTAFEMGSEQEFIYLFTHFAKHYRDGGIGLSHVIDLWVYMRAKPTLDMEYIVNELKKLRLDVFCENICTLIDVWFADAESNEKTDFITDFIFKSGVWGKHTTHVVATVLRESKSTKTLFAARIKRMWKLTFVSYHYMRQQYKILERAPILLPIFWFVRIIDILVFTRGKFKRHSQEFMYADFDNVNEYQQALNFVGLDFYFEE